MSGSPNLKDDTDHGATAQLQSEVEHLKQRLHVLEAGEARPAGGAEAAEASLAAVVGGAPEAIVTLDQDFRVRVFNARAEALFGYRAEDVYGKSFGLFVQGVPIEGGQAALLQLLTPGPDQPVDSPLAFAGLHCDGTEIPAEVQVSRLEEAGEAHYVLVLRDTSKRQLAQEALVTAKNEAEIANRAKSEFLANMSHELRNPLNAIIGFSEIIQNEALGPVGQPDYKDYAENIQISGRHLLKLINDILDLSKIEVGKLALNEDVFEVADIIHSCVVLMGGQAREAGIILTQDSSSMLPRVRADERMLRQILINLLSNAVKFTPKGGKVTIKAWDHPGDGFVLQVADTGIGMTLEDIPRAMIRFAQTPSPVTRRFEGNGLGLPLTKSLIELHGGSLDVQSKIDVGTTVTVRLPAERVVRVDQSGADQSGADQSGADQSGADQSGADQPESPQPEGEAEAAAS